MNDVAAASNDTDTRKYHGEEAYCGKCGEFNSDWEDGGFWGDEADFWHCPTCGTPVADCDMEIEEDTLGA